MSRRGQLQHLRPVFGFCGFAHCPARDFDGQPALFYFACCVHCHWPRESRRTVTASTAAGRYFLLLPICDTASSCWVRKSLVWLSWATRISSAENCAR